MIKDPFVGYTVIPGTVTQHQSQLIMALLLQLIDFIWKVNEHPEFSFQIKILAANHCSIIFSRYISLKLHKNHYHFCRLIINYLASGANSIIIIVTISLYQQAFAQKINTDGTKASSLCLSNGVWHMVNVYQFWVLLEIIAFFSNILGMIVALIPLNVMHSAIKRSLRVPMALV